MESWETGVRKKDDIPMDREQMKKNLLDIKRVLDKHGIRFFLYMGTLLGAVRDGNFIEWDDDADLLCFAEDKERYERLAIPELEQRGFYVPQDGVSATDSFIIRGRENRREKVDCWWFRRQGSFYVYDPERCPNWLSYDHKFFDNTGQMEFLGEQFAIPNEVDKFLELHYGKEWVIPTRSRGWVF